MQDAQNQIQELFEKYPEITGINFDCLGFIWVTFLNDSDKTFNTLIELLEHLETTK